MGMAVRMAAGSKALAQRLHGYRERQACVKPLVTAA
jgi:hypothetical protein